MIMGNSPYYGKTEEELYKNILEKELKYPSRLDPDAKDCLVRLFNRDASRRLGVTSRVLAHPFFDKVLDVNAVCNRQVRPPFVPRDEESFNSSATAYFDTEFTKAAARLSKIEEQPIDTEQRFFSDFEYNNDKLLEKYGGKKLY